MQKQNTKVNITKLDKFWKDLMIAIEKLFKEDTPQIFQWLCDVVKGCVNE